MYRFKQFSKLYGYKQKYYEIIENSYALVILSKYWQHYFMQKCKFSICIYGLDSNNTSHKIIQQT